MNSLYNIISRKNDTPFSNDIGNAVLQDGKQKVIETYACRTINGIISSPKDF